jgi:hypothetical protein
VSVDAWCSFIELKICELQSLVTQSLPFLSFVGPRVRTLLLHLLGGLRHLTASGLCTSGRDIAAVERLQEQLENIERLMTGDGQPDRSTGEGSSQQDGTMEHNMNSLPSANAVMSFPSGVYQKLPSPLNYLLNEVPVVDGNDSKILCEFFLKAINISNVGHIYEPTIYELFYSYCMGELGTLLN